MSSQIPPSNFLAGRQGQTVQLIVGHHTAGSAEAALARFADPASQVSAHDIIRRDGTRIPLVSWDDTAFHAGVWGVNIQSLGWEFEWSDGDQPEFTDAQYATGQGMVREAEARYGWTVGGANIQPHHAYVPTACPGGLDLARLAAAPGSPPQPQPEPQPEPSGGDLDVADRDFLYQQLVTVGHAAGVNVPTPPWASPPEQRSYVVKPGDSLSGIAQDQLGDGNRWPEIYQLNQAEIGQDPNLIQPGQVLALPAS